jgi:DNA methylase (fragment)
MDIAFATELGNGAVNGDTTHHGNGTVLLGSVLFEVEQNLKRTTHNSDFLRFTKLFIVRLFVAMQNIVVQWERNNPQFICLFLFIDVPLQKVIPEVQVGFCAVPYCFSQSSPAKEVVTFW